MSYWESRKGQGTISVFKEHAISSSPVAESQTESKMVIAHHMMESWLWFYLRSFKQNIGVLLREVKHRKNGVKKGQKPSQQYVNQRNTRPSTTYVTETSAF